VSPRPAAGPSPMGPRPNDLKVTHRRDCQMSREQKWNQHRENWVTQYNRWRRPPASSSHYLEERKAGRWQSRQRMAHNKGTLSQERQDILETTAGWSWDSDPFDTQRQNWIAQTTRLGRAPSRNTTDVNEKQAAHWRSNQIQMFNRGKMTQEHTDQLDNTPGWTWFS
jgi:hypothetical protein